MKKRLSKQPPTIQMITREYFENYTQIKRKI
jgi:hypothetical protein